MSKKIPEFKNEDEESEFRAAQDSTEYINLKQAKRVTLPNLKPSVKKISLRLPESMLEAAKIPTDEERFQASMGIYILMAAVLLVRPKGLFAADA